MKEDFMKRMRWLLAGSMALTLAASGMAYAEMGPGDAHHRAFGAGFHNSEAPVGFRYWFSNQKVALDLGLGFGSEPAFIDPDEKETHFALEAGVPFVCHSWERVHALIRPGILYQSQEVGFDSDTVTPGIQFDTETVTSFAVSLEGEAEVFLADNVSVSAAHGIRFVSVDPGFGADSQTSFETTGNNFTTIGFHIYLYK
jgi:hypothetical protein